MKPGPYQRAPSMVQPMPIFGKELAPFGKSFARAWWCTQRAIDPPQRVVIPVPISPKSRDDVLATALAMNLLK
jgi:hypothetical protein